MTLNDILMKCEAEIVICHVGMGRLSAMIECRTTDTASLDELVYRYGELAVKQISPVSSEAMGIWLEAAA